VLLGRKWRYTFRGLYGFFCGVGQTPHLFTAQTLFHRILCLSKRLGVARGLSISVLQLPPPEIVPHLWLLGARVLRIAPSASQGVLISSSLLERSPRSPPAVQDSGSQRLRYFLPDDRGDSRARSWPCRPAKAPSLLFSRSLPGCEEKNEMTSVSCAPNH